MDITTLSPTEVWKNFAEICAIPHASGNEKQLSCFLADKAEKMGFEGSGEGISSHAVVTIIRRA